jgi:protein associated with RNAse G/E
MIESLVNNCIGKTWKEMAVAYFKAPYWYFLMMIYENDKNLSR